MNIRNSILLAATATLLFAGCNGNLTRKGFFWTSVKPANGTLTLFMDGKKVGDLPYIDTTYQGEPRCGVDSTTAQCLTASVPNGKIKFEAKDASGNVKSNSTVVNKDNIMGRKSSVTSGIGGSAMTVTDVCVIGNFYY